MSITYEELELEHFKAFSKANSLAESLGDLFIGRRMDSLTDKEWQAIAPLFSNDPLGVVDAHRLVEVDGVITSWHDSPEGQAYWAGLFAHAMREE